MDNLLFDILTLIPSHFLSFPDVLSFSLVCKKWYDATLLCSEINAPVVIHDNNIHWKLNLTHIILNKKDHWSEKNLEYIEQQLRISSSLKIINFSRGHNLTDEIAIRLLRKCPRLECINFSNCTSLTDKVSEFIATCPENFMNLWSINFNCNELTDESIKYISKCPNIRNVNFGGNDLTDESIRYISNCTNLRKIDFSFCRLLTDDAIRYISNCPENFTKLRKINFSGCHQLTDKAIEYLLKCPENYTNLQSVDFGYCNITDESGKLLSHCVNLQKVCIRHCSLLTPDFIEYISKCINLQNIDCTSCTFSKESLENFALKYKKIKLIDKRQQYFFYESSDEIE